MKKCINCNIEFTPDRTTNIYCSVKCRVIVKNIKRRGSGVKDKIVKKCNQCSVEYKAYRRNQKYCSKYCGNKQWSQDNKEIARNSRCKWNKNNPEKKLALTNLRRSNKLRATPKWLTESMKNEIEIIYLIARSCTKASDNRVTYHVDHIYPLQGKEVCGLHVPWNLQVIRSDKNIIKSNKLPKEYLNEQRL